MKKGDVVLINFPFSDLSYTKRRPALVLNGLEGEDIILCSITTRKGNFDKYVVNLDNGIVENLNFESYIKVDKLFSLRKNLVIKKIGHISSKDVIRNVDKKLCLLLKLKI